MQLEIVTDCSDEVTLISRRTNATFICPREGEAVVIGGDHYVVRQVLHIYGLHDETLKLFVELK